LVIDDHCYSKEDATEKPFYRQHPAQKRRITMGALSEANLASLAQKFSIGEFVETGTFVGYGAAWGVLAIVSRGRLDHQ
jgi:hypothetical protein